MKRIRILDDKAMITEKLSVLIEPMIGVSPITGNLATALLGNHGGNLECKDVKNVLQCILQCIFQCM